tara:strand:- start:4958 stop:5212 length:255 start_codon:yes stop_codon:yes gene_type:complete
MVDNANSCGLEYLSYVCELALRVSNDENRPASANVNAANKSRILGLHVPDFPIGSLKNAVYTIMTTSKTPMYVMEVYKEIERRR